MTPVICSTRRGFYMGALVLLTLVNEFRKSDKIHGLHDNVIAFSQQVH